MKILHPEKFINTQVFCLDGYASSNNMTDYNNLIKLLNSERWAITKIIFDPLKNLIRFTFDGEEEYTVINKTNIYINDQIISTLLDPTIEFLYSLWSLNIRHLNATIKDFLVKNKKLQALYNNSFSVEEKNTLSMMLLG